MAPLLYRLGRFSFRRRGLVSLAWLVALVAMIAGAATLSGPTSDAFSIPGTQSQKALDLLEERMPAAGVGNASARVVFVAPDGASITDPDVRASIEGVATEVAGQPHVTSALSPYDVQAVSPDGTTAFMSVSYSVTSDEVTDEDRELLEDAIAAVEADGIGAAAGGSATQAQPHAAPIGEIIGLGVAAVVLFLTFGALVAAGLPLLTAIVGVGFGLLGIQIATGFFDLSSTTMTLATMLGLAVGIDYALFIISRYRHELLGTHDPAHAIGMAIGTAGSAVVFAGLTVAIALVALVVVGIPFLSAMGLAAAGTVVVAVLLALTLLPALLGFAGMRVLGRKGYRAPDTEHDSTAKPTFGDRWAEVILRHRAVVAAGAVALLVVIALPATSLRLGLPTDATAAEGSSPREAYDQITEAFGPGLNGPLVLAVDLADAPDPTAALAAIRADLDGLDNIANVGAENLNEAGDLAIVSIIPMTGPSDAATEDLVGDIRSRADTWADQTGADVSVTGETAVAIDVSETLADALIPYLSIIVGLAFVLLVLVFRSLLVPLKATLGFLLSILAAFGGVVAVFQWGWLKDLIALETTGPIISFLPIILIGILFGLAMDYEVFLVTRMREAFVHGDSAEDAIKDGFRHGSRVVTAAAVIMIGVFAGFVFADDPIIKSIGFALALGVALDAFVVRMILVPAVLSLMGDRAWYLPGWLDRVLPDIDIEGSQLERSGGTADDAASGATSTDEPLAGTRAGH
ncbi:MAG: MMPL family transporter [Actinomycetota bacterium]|nr:MMPL family transporter [Actinomycetota bacterium]